MIRFAFVAGLLVASMLGQPLPLFAQNIAGEYQVEVLGTTYYLDRQPDVRQLRDNTTLTITQNGDQIEITFGSFAGAMSATVFRGRIGNGRFVAVWSPAASEGDARVITGEVGGPRVRGRLVYPRATAAAGVPGWTEVEFAAVAHETSSGSAGGGAFDVGVAAITVPDVPLAGHRVEFVARGTPARRGESVARMELRINGVVRGSSSSALLEVVAGPFQAGRLVYDVVAISSDGRRSTPTTHTVDVRTAGNTTISGQITGRRDKISNVQLVLLDDRTVAIATLDGNGRYRISGVPAGDYVIFVNDAKTEAMVSPTSNLRIRVDGKTSYTRDFSVR